MWPLFQYIDDILRNLTPDDIRCLLIAEDELARSAPLERIFPSSSTYKYLQYIESPRYYNRLLDAWEHRYGGHRREKGIALIRKFCEDKVHLVVPVPPTKKVNIFIDSKRALVLCKSAFSFLYTNPHKRTTIHSVFFLFFYFTKMH